MAYTIGENKCGCKVRASEDEDVKNPYWIDYCPKHAAAPELYEAAKEMISALNGTYLDDRQRAKEHLEQAISKIEEFIPQTELGEQLIQLRNEALRRGTPLLNENEILAKVEGKEQGDE